ncbi:MAG: fumarate reductase subunit A [Methanospirillaceae archaeon]|nr:fumarate reductase subunit A [Methanospirillaceae archaeon]
MLGEQIHECHVAVIGSGGAGIRAAIEASSHGETLLISKTIAGKGGCTIMAEGGYNAVMCEADCTDDHYQDTMRGGAYLNDPELVRVLVSEAPLRMNDLISWGAVFDVTPECTIAQRPFGGQKFPRTCYAGDRTGHEMMMTLMDRYHACGAETLHEVDVIDLIPSKEGITGLVGLDRKGDLVIVHADAVILATGGGTRIYDISTNSMSGTGDGYAIGYRAGATLIDMEQIQFHPTGAVYPRDARGRLITEAVRGEGGVLKNTKGERFMSRYDPERMELSTRDVVARAVATEIQEGRGTEHGGVYLDVTHLKPEEIERRLPIMLEQYLQFGVDIRKEPMEVAPTAHHIMGGLKITPDGATTIRRLYACGEVTGGVHGANRLGGNALADTQVFGKRAGEAAALCSRISCPDIDPMIHDIRELLGTYREGTINPAAVITELRLAMWEGAGIFRDEGSLTRCRETIERLMKMTPKAVSNQNLAECCTVRNMCTTAHLIVTSALLRKESRGSHLRTDCTEIYNPEKSLFGHTGISPAGARIERRNS